jgi:hypothetical protein
LLSESVDNGPEISTRSLPNKTRQPTAGAVALRDSLRHETASRRHRPLEDLNHRWRVERLFDDHVLSVGR